MLPSSNFRLTFCVVGFASNWLDSGMSGFIQAILVTTNTDVNDDANDDDGDDWQRKVGFMFPKLNVTLDIGRIFQ